MRKASKQAKRAAEEKTQTFTTVLGSGAELTITRTIVAPPPQAEPVKIAPLDEQELDENPVRATAQVLSNYVDAMRAPQDPYDATPRVTWEIRLRRAGFSGAASVEEGITLAHVEAEELFAILNALRELGHPRGYMGMP